MEDRRSPTMMLAAFSAIACLYVVAVAFTMFF